MSKQAEIIETLKQGVFERYSLLPKYKFPTTNELSVQSMTQHIIDCSTALEAHREFLADSAIVTHQLNAVIKNSVLPSDMDNASDARDEILAYCSAVEMKTTSLNTNLTTLRGLLSAMKKSKTSMGQVLIDE